MPDDEQTLELPDGRRLGLAEYGRPDGEPCFYFHGHPGSRFEAEVAHELAAGAGIRVLALDRPGYGLSDFQPERTMLGWPRDVEAVADRLGLERFAVLGASGGGPYALACGRALPERVHRIGLISSIAPYQAPGVTKGMRRQNRVGFQAGARFPPLSRLIMWSMARQLRRDPERTLDAIVSAMSPSDVETARRPEVLPVLLWHGEEDVLATPEMGRHLARTIPECSATFYPGEGHLLAFEHMREIVRAFAAA